MKWVHIVSMIDAAVSAAAAATTQARQATLLYTSLLSSQSLSKAWTRPDLFPGMSKLTFLTTPAVPSHVVAAHLSAIVWVVWHRLVPIMHTTCIVSC